MIIFKYHDDAHSTAFGIDPQDVPNCLSPSWPRMKCWKRTSGHPNGNKSYTPGDMGHVNSGLDCLHDQTKILEFYYGAFQRTFRFDPCYYIYHYMTETLLVEGSVADISGDVRRWLDNFVLDRIERTFPSSTSFDWRWQGTWMSSSIRPWWEQ